MSEISNNSTAVFSFLCQSHSLSEEGLRGIFESHKLTPNNHHVSDYQFFREACRNVRVTEGIIRYLLEYFPDAASAANLYGQLPLHFALCNTNMTLNIIKLLIDAAPDFICSVDEDGYMPLHCLCISENIVDEAAALEIMKLLIEKCPESVRRTDNDGCLPIHLAAISSKSPEFCRVLIEAYPRSERIVNHEGALPLHWACTMNTVATVEYLHKLYPDAINHESAEGYYPIHYAIMGVTTKGSTIHNVEIVHFLLDCDPIVKLQKYQGRCSLLHFACFREYNGSNIDAAVEIIKAIYDAHPEAIEDNRISSTIQRYHQRIQTFINSQLVYARLAKDRRLMTTPDDSRQLPLHRALQALQNNATLGSIKLLVKGNPPAVQSPDNCGAIPLHVACVHHDSVKVVQFLIGLDATTLDAVDRDGNTALHLACCVARHEIIALLLDEFDAVSVSERNARGKLPIDLLWECIGDRESTEYTESVFRLLRAYPEMMMGINIQMKTASAFCPSQSGKKRKLGY